MKIPHNPNCMKNIPDISEEEEILNETPVISSEVIHTCIDR